MPEELARRDDAALVVPNALRELGVTIAEDGSGARAVVLPAELRQKANVLLPVSSVMQAVELVQPSIRVVELDPDPEGPHFYNQGTRNKPRLAPRKQALETLAFTAGISLSRTRPMSKAELSAYEEGTIGFEATIAMRRPDGTLHYLSASKVWQPSIEFRKVKNAVASWGSNWDNPPSEAARAAELEKRWTTEREFGPAKTESKATLRAIRSALQIPHTFTAQDAGKPFVVVGYDLALNYDDPDIVRALLEGSDRRTAELYGSSVEESPASVADAGDRPTAAQPSRPGDAAAVEPREETGAAEATQTADAAPAPPPFTGEEPPEEEADPEPAPADPAAVTLEGEGWDATRYAGQTVAAIAAAGDRTYLRWLASDAVGDETIRAAAKVALDGLPK